MFIISKSSHTSASNFLSTFRPLATLQVSCIPKGQARDMKTKHSFHYLVLVTNLHHLTLLNWTNLNQPNTQATVHQRYATLTIWAASSVTWNMREIYIRKLGEEVQMIRIANKQFALKLTRKMKTHTHICHSFQVYSK